MGSIFPRPDEPGDEPEPESPSDDSIGWGIFIALACQIICVMIGAVSGIARGSILEWWGFVQWIGLIPLIIWQAKSGHLQIVKGIFITGCICSLVNAGCDAALGALSH